MTMSDEDGKIAVSIARDSLESTVGRKPFPTKERLPPVFAEKRGVFVTLNAVDETVERLRGCIGFPYPVKKLSEAIREASAMAATEDPRFQPVTEPELTSVAVEVSVLTVPQPLKAPNRRRYPSQVSIGRDGLIVSNSWTSGLLLPQVATEFGMDPTEFLSQACMKAGLAPDAWLEDGVSVEIFQADVFTETEPRGEVKRVLPREA